MLASLEVDMIRRHELTDSEWARIRHHFAPARTGRPPGDYRTRVNGIMWILRTGAPWRDLPDRYGPWKTSYNTFSKWTKAGVWKEVLDDLLLDLDEAGLIANDLWCVDGTSVRAHRVAAGALHTGG